MKKRLRKKIIKQKRITQLEQLGYSKKEIKTKLKSLINKDSRNEKDFLTKLETILNIEKRYIDIITSLNIIISDFDAKVKSSKVFCSQYGIEFDDENQYIIFEQEFIKLLNRFTTGDLKKGFDKFSAYKEDFETIESVILRKLEEVKYRTDAKAIIEGIALACTTHETDLHFSSNSTNRDEVSDKTGVKPKTMTKEEIRRRKSL